MINLSITAGEAVALLAAAICYKPGIDSRSQELNGAITLLAMGLSNGSISPNNAPGEAQAQEAGK